MHRPFGSVVFSNFVGFLKAKLNFTAESEVSKGFMVICTVFVVSGREVTYMGKGQTD